MVLRREFVTTEKEILFDAADVLRMGKDLFVQHGFTTNLKGSRKFLQVSVGVSTQYDEKVMETVDQHQLSLRSEILTTISDFTEEDIAGSDGKKKLSTKLLEVLNKKLDSLKEFPGIEDVYFTAFILQ
jgi:flagellar FliL protein